MTFWGLHLADIAMLVVFFAGMLWIGKRTARTIKGTADYYLAGRKLGKTLQFFLNFGSMTDSIGAPITASEVYRQGLGGAWMMFQYVFITPFLWFAKVWWRRARVVTLGDLLTARFDCRACGGLFAVYAILFYTVIIGFGNVTTYKVMRALLVKPPEQHTIAERQRLADYREFATLKALHGQGRLPAEKTGRYGQLSDLDKKGKLESFVSYLDNPVPFYLTYSAVIAFYVVLGGFMAAVWTDAVQGLLILAFSFMLIPFGLGRVGGLEGLRANLPETMTRLFGAAESSDYTWYAMLAMLATTLVGWFSSAHDIAISGSARDEFSARVGAVTGAFGKRIVTLAWICCGLLAVGLWTNTLSDPDMAWGTMCRALLPAGFLGLMLAGILGGHMSSLNASILTASALFVRNGYAVVLPGRPDRHYMLVGRIAAATVLALGIVVAMFATGIMSLFKVLLTLPAIFGAAVLLAVFWRRLTRVALLAEVLVCLLVLGVLPFALPAIPSFRQHPALTLQTPERRVREAATGEIRVVPAASVYFDAVVRVNPADPASPLEGVGRFNAEVYLAGLVGMPVGTFSKAGLLATRFGVCTVLPFLLLVVISWLTPRTPAAVLDRFHARMRTPVAATPELDAVEIERSLADPQRHEHQRLFPGSNWEFMKWDRTDTVGFLLCWAGVGVILLLLGGIAWVLK